MKLRNIASIKFGEFLVAILFSIEKYQVLPVEVFVSRVTGDCILDPIKNSPLHMSIVHANARVKYHISSMKSLC
jgi:hypothetical protein